MREGKRECENECFIYCFIPQMPSTGSVRPDQSEEPGAPSRAPAWTATIQILKHRLLPSRAISRKLDHKWSSWDSNQPLQYGDMSVSNSSLICCTIAATTHNWFSSGFSYCTLFCGVYFQFYLEGIEKRRT